MISDEQLGKSLLKNCQRVIKKCNSMENKCNNLNVQQGGAFNDRSDAWWVGFLSGIDDDDDNQEPINGCLLLTGFVAFGIIAYLSPETITDYLNGELCGASVGLICPE
jgi:hypothetical protein